MEPRLQLLGASLDALPVNVSVLDSEGTIVHTNESWRTFGQHNGIRTDPDTIGINYLDICERAGTSTAQQVGQGLSALIEGDRDGFQLEYPCHSPIEQRWFRLVAAPMTFDDRQYVVVCHVDITECVLETQRAESERDRLATLADLNAAVRELTHVVVNQSMWPAIADSVCTLLAETDAYRCVWLGAIDGRTGGITVRATAGDCEQIVTVGADVDADTIQGYNAVRQAAWSQTFQTTTSMLENTAFDWRTDGTESHTHQSIAAVPISHEGTLYSVLCVYTDRSRAFESDERAILEGVGEIVGHAITASRRQRALLSDGRQEVDLRMPGWFDRAVDGGGSWSVRITQTLAGDDDSYVMYGLTSEDDLETVRSLVDRRDDMELSVVGSDGERVRIVLETTRQCVEPLLAAHGWSAVETELENGDYYVTVRIPYGENVRRMIEEISEAFPETELLARRHVTPPPPDERLPTPAMADLTDRQRTILRTAHAAGYFEWPRDTSGEAVAETLGISSPTFHQHLRTAEKKLMDAILAERPMTA